MLQCLYVLQHMGTTNTHICKSHTATASHLYLPWAAMHTTVAQRDVHACGGDALILTASLQEVNKLCAQLREDEHQI